VRPGALPRSFYLRPTEEVARDLLGKTLVREIRGRIAAVRIVEVEAYLGVNDPACHTFRGRRTPRVEPMWGIGGLAYVYFTYGMHHCVNVVTRSEGEPEAVLIRAGQPVAGVESMKRRRPSKTKTERLASGPACLCTALDIDRRHSGLDLVAGKSLWIGEGERVAGEVAVGAGRIGVDYAGEAASWPLRFLFLGHPSVSVPPNFEGKIRPIRKKKSISA